MVLKRSTSTVIGRRACRWGRVLEAGGGLRVPEDLTAILPEILAGRNRRTRIHVDGAELAQDEPARISGTPQADESKRASGENFASAEPKHQRRQAPLWRVQAPDFSHARRTPHVLARAHAGRGTKKKEPPRKTLGGSDIRRLPN